MAIPATDIAYVSKPKALRLLAFNLAFVAFIYAGIPIVAGASFARDLRGAGYQSAFLYLALIGGLYFWYSIALIAWAMSGGRGRGVFIEGERLTYLNRWTFSVPLSAIDRLDVLSRPVGGVEREFVEAALADGRKKIFPTQILDRSGREIIRAISMRSHQPGSLQ